MEARRHVLPVDHVAVHDGDVLLGVAVVPERDDAEIAEPRRQLGDADDLHADLAGPESLALVVPVPLDQELKRHSVGHADSFIKRRRPGSDGRSKRVCENQAG